MIINPGATLTILPGQSLTVHGVTTLNGAQCLIIKSNNTGTGSFIDNGIINGNGTAKVERYITGNVWHYISAPVTIATASVFSGQYLKSWNENNYSWSNLITPAAPIATLQGYALKSLSSSTYNFSSKPNTGSLQLLLTRNSNLPLSKQGWCLAGNPYPSSIDWDAPLGWNKINVDNAVYVYNQSYSNYAVYNNGIGVNGGSRYLPPMQGFFITCNNNSGGIIEMNNQVRIHNNTGFLKSEAEPDYIRLTLKNEAWRDEIVVRICQQSSAGFDGQFDAYKFMDGGLSQLWTENSNSSSVQYAINTIPDVQNGAEIPVVFRPAHNGLFSITASEFEHLIQHTGIFLEDLKTGVTTNLADTPEYYFTADTGDAVHRFVLHFEAAVISGKQPLLPVESSASTVVPNPNNGVFTVVPGNRIKEQYYISIANAEGRIIYNSSRAMQGDQRIFAGTLRRGLYYLRMKTSVRTEIVKFIVAE